MRVIPLVHYNADGRLVGGGRTSWLTTLRGYALKISLVIDDIKRQPTKEMEAIKEALE